MPDRLSGRCYCGAVTFQAGAPQAVVYCHCEDCRRWTGAPLPAFVAIADDDLTLNQDLDSRVFGPGVARRCCPDCGSPLTAEFSYLPGQVFLPLGVIDQADALPPQMHAHADRKMPWLHVQDDTPRIEGTSRAELSAAGDQK